MSTRRQIEMVLDAKPFQRSSQAFDVPDCAILTAYSNIDHAQAFIHRGGVQKLRIALFGWRIGLCKSPAGEHAQSREHLRMPQADVPRVHGSPRDARQVTNRTSP